MPTLFSTIERIMSEKNRIDQNKPDQIRTEQKSENVHGIFRMKLLHQLPVASFIKILRNTSLHLKLWIGKANPIWGRLVPKYIFVWHANLLLVLFRIRELGRKSNSNSNNYSTSFSFDAAFMQSFGQLSSNYNNNKLLRVMENMLLLLSMK